MRQVLLPVGGMERQEERGQAHLPYPELINVEILISPRMAF
jgi:hypothetical protein